MLSLVLLTFLPSAWAGCSATNFSLASLDFCAPHVSNKSSALSEQGISDWVIEEGLQFTNGSCTFRSETYTTSSSYYDCSIDSFQGSATNQCLDDVLAMLCTYAAAYAESSSESCNLATQAVFTIDECVNVVNSCAATADIDSRAYCAAFACDGTTDNCLNGGSCDTAFTDAVPVCSCPSDFHGTFCEYEYFDCPEASNGFICSGHGECDTFVGQCTCESEFAGVSCSTVSCIRGDVDQNGDLVTEACNGHGICHTVGVCQCDAGYIGTSCTIQISDEGMTSGELAGAVIGGLIFSALMSVMIYKLYTSGD
jgi:hypothetical protein